MTASGQVARRLKSLDALRGFDMLFLCGLSAVCRGFCKLFPGGEDWSFFRQFEHVRWEGLHVEDLIFPLFIFIAGLSFPFSHAKQVEKGVSGARQHLRILKRMLLLIALGWVYNGQLLGGSFAKFDFLGWSIFGYIGIAWATAALVYLHLGTKARILVTAALVAGYWAAMQFVAPDAPPGATPWSAAGCVACWIGRKGFRTWIFLSMVGCSVSALLGMFAGDVVRSVREGLTPGRKSGVLAGIGALLLAAGFALTPTCPIVKNIWTPTFALVAGGYSFLAFALFHFVIDVKGFARWCFPLEVVGMNAMLAYLLPRFVDFDKASRFFFGSFAQLFPTPDFVLALGHMAVCWTVLWYLYRNKTFLKV